MSAELSAAFPGRQSQIATLGRLLRSCESGSLPTPALHIWGAPASGKTAVVQAVLEGSRSQVAWVKCLECYSARLFYERVLSALGHPDDRVVTLMDFVNALSRILPESGPTPILVVDHADRLLRLTPPTLIASLLRLSDLTGRRVCVILISQLVWDRLRPRPGCRDPLILHFDAYSEDQMRRILEADCPLEEQPDPRLYAAFVELVVKVFRHACKNINELRFIVSALFPKYLEPTRAAEAPLRRDPVKLYARIEPYFRTMLAKLYLRDVSALELDASLDAADAEDAAKRAAAVRGLAFYVKFLVIAAFLASYNPPRLDARYFSRGNEGATSTARGRASGGAAAAPSSASGRVRQQLLGPKSFPVDRMLAIFYSILDRPLDSTVDIHIQISTLVSLRLLTQVTSLDGLEAVKYRCNVPFEMVRELADSVQLDVHRLLYDFR